MNQDAGLPDGGPADRPLVLGVAGGSGSGKSTVVRKVIERMPGIPVRLLHHDSYYRDHPDLALEERAEINYDAARLKERVRGA